MNPFAANITHEVVFIIRLNRSLNIKIYKCLVSN